MVVNSVSLSDGLPGHDSISSVYCGHTCRETASEEIRNEPAGWVAKYQAD